MIDSGVSVTTSTALVLKEASNESFYRTGSESVASQAVLVVLYIFLAAMIHKIRQRKSQTAVCGV